MTEHIYFGYVMLCLFSLICWMDGIFENLVNAMNFVKSAQENLKEASFGRRSFANGQPWRDGKLLVQLALAP